MAGDGEAVERCVNCRYYDPDSLGDEWGACRRRAPVPIPFHRLEDEGGSAAWPEVYEDDWCGEYRPRPAKREEVRDE